MTAVPGNVRRPATRPLQTVWPGWATWLAAGLVFGLAFTAVGWRLNLAPDVFTDEILYTRAGLRVAGEGALVWDNAEPLFVHPPLYFLFEGLFVRLTADPSGALQTPGDVFGWVYHIRRLNALFAGLTAVVLFVAGSRVRGPKLGLLLAALFFLDPFAVRINRRAMLETMAGFFSLAGVALLLIEKGRYRPGRAVLAGLLMGAGILTKELTFTAPAAVMLFGLWEYLRGRRLGRPSRAPRRAFVAVAVAGLSYALFPLWALSTGRWDRFAAVKFLSFRRLLGLVQISGWNRPEFSLADFLLQRLNDYGTSYLLLLLGGAATLLLWLARRHSPSTRLLAAWGLTLYPFYAFVALLGAGNDQFFYFLLVPAILLIGYTLTIFPEAVGQALSVVPATRTWLTIRFGRRLRRIRAFVLLELLVLALTFNAARWWLSYGAGADNAYLQLKTFVEQTLPSGAPLNATGDAIKFRYFFPNRPVTDAGLRAEAQSAGVHYFALAPKDVWAHYGTITKDLADWVQTEGELLLSLHGLSYGDLYLYRVNYREPPLRQKPPAKTEPYSPARASFVDTFISMLGLWLLLCGGLALWLKRRISAPPARRTWPAPALETHHETP